MADHARDGLLREIDEELRQEHYAKLWKRYGKYVVALALAVVIGVAGFQAWQAYDLKTRRADSDAFAFAKQLLNEDKPGDAADAFRALADDATAGYALLARFQEAGAVSRQGRPEDAAAIYAGIAADDGVEKIYRDLATLLRAIELADTGDPAQLTADLTPLAADGNPWRYGAREMLALLAFRQGDSDKARQAFQTLAEDVDAPGGIRSRARDMLSVMGG